jgi:hypothetical protein
MVNQSKTTKKQDTSSTFVNNMSLPIHRWFRYSAGFSAQWVEDTIKRYLIDNGINGGIKVLDPFAGSGTTLLASEMAGMKSYGFESHPLISRVAKTKMMWRTDVGQFRSFADNTLSMAKQIEGDGGGYPDLIYKCYSPDNIQKLDSIKKALYAQKDESAEYSLTWLGFLSILRSSSHAGTAQWQYVLPNKTKVNVSDPFEAFARQIALMAEDMTFAQQWSTVPQGDLINHDTRKPFEPLENEIDLIITSPPYANNYDYADATRLELSFLGDISGWGDLQESIRPHLIRSCTQHVSSHKKETFLILEDSALKPIFSEIFDVCTKLDSEKELHGGKKNYHTMIALYFLDMAKAWKCLRSVCKEGASACFVIGDSAPYGIYVPVDKWLGELAIAAGFTSYTFEKTRDRNIKWENRKHRVPLKEGRLWVKG